MLICTESHALPGCVQMTTLPMNLCKSHRAQGILT